MSPYRLLSISIEQPSQIVQVYQSAAYSSSMNHLFCDRLSVIVPSEQFGRSQWKTGNRRGFICYCLINAINISCNKWTHSPLILCWTFLLSGQMGKLQHLGFDSTRVTSGSEARVRIRLPDCIFFFFSSVVEIVAVAATDWWYDKFRAVRIQTF